MHPVFFDISYAIIAPKTRTIAETEYNNNGLKNFETIAPFLDKEYLNNVAKESIEKEGIQSVIPIAPFLQKNMLSEYIKEHYL